MCRVFRATRFAFLDSLKEVIHDVKWCEWRWAAAPGSEAGRAGSWGTGALYAILAQPLGGVSSVMGSGFQRPPAGWQAPQKSSTGVPRQ